MPAPLGKQRIWDPATGMITDEFGNQIPPTGKQPNLLSSPGQQPPAGDSGTFGEEDPQDFVRSLLSGGLQLSAGLVPGGLPLRTALAAASGGIGGLIEGDNPVDSMVGNAALEGSFGSLASVLPKIGTKLALATGGVGKLSRAERQAAAEAFGRQRDRFFGGQKPAGDLQESLHSTLGIKPPKPRASTFRDALAHPLDTLESIKDRGLPTTPTVGSGKSARLRKKVGKRMEGLETSTPGTVDWGPVINDSLNDLLSQAKGAEVPPDYIRKIVENESRYIQGQQAVRGHTTAEPVREVMEMGRQESARGKEIFSQRKKGEFIPADDILHAKINAARGSGLKDAALAEADKTTLPGHSKSQGTRIRDANEEFSDLAEMASASSKMRGGTLFAGGRGGMGFALGKVIEHMLGVPYAGEILGTTFMGATPSMISRVGNLAGRAAEVGPTIERARRLRRRKPRDEQDQ